eukprot:tig00001355_g8345.t1
MASSFLAATSGRESHPCRIHPLVLFNVVDHFMRRAEQQERVIGTLLGYMVDGQLEITNSFPVPHTELGDNVAVDIEFHKNLFELHQRVNQKEAIIGWYATGDVIDDKTALIHQFYQGECANPVLLMVDTSLKSDSVGMMAYMSSAFGVGDRPFGQAFSRVKAELKTGEMERVALDAINKGVGDARANSIAPLDNLEAMEACVRKLVSMLDTVLAYIDDVIAGKRKGDAQVGRFLWEAVQSVPKLSRESFEKIFNNGLQDLLMVTYLASLTKTQIALSEKLQSSVAFSGTAFLTA